MTPLQLSTLRTVASGTDDPIFPGASINYLCQRGWLRQTKWLLARKFIKQRTGRAVLTAYGRRWLKLMDAP